MQFGPKVVPMTRPKGEGISVAVRPGGSRCQVQLLVNMTSELCKRLPPDRFDVQFGEGADRAKILITLTAHGAFGASIQKKGPTTLLCPLPPCVSEITFDPTDGAHFRIGAVQARWEILSERGPEKQIMVEIPLDKFKATVAVAKASPLKIAAE